MIDFIKLLTILLIYFSICFETRSLNIYKERVGIRETNTVLFSIPAESLAIFLQQLGRDFRVLLFVRELKTDCIRAVTGLYLSRHSRLCKARGQPPYDITWR